VKPLVDELCEALHLVVEEIDDTYEASCEAGGNWQGGASLATSTCEIARAALQRARREIIPKRPASMPDPDRGAHPNWDKPSVLGHLRDDENPARAALVGIEKWFGAVLAMPESERTDWLQAFASVHMPMVRAALASLRAVIEEENP